MFRSLFKSPPLKQDGGAGKGADKTMNPVEEVNVASSRTIDDKLVTTQSVLTIAPEPSSSSRNITDGKFLFHREMMIEPLISPLFIFKDFRKNLMKVNILVYKIS